MKDELWLKKLKEQMDDYIEPVPVSGWERLEKELSAARKPRHAQPRMVTFRRWAVAAAAVLLAAVSSVSLWLLQSPVGDEVRNMSASALAVAPDVLPEQATPALQTEPTPPTLRVTEDATITSHQTRRSLVAQHIETETVEQHIETEEETEQEMRHENPDKTESMKPQQAEEPTAKNNVRKERYRPSGRDKLHLPDKSKSKSSSKGVGVGLFIGNTGNLLSANGEERKDVAFDSSINGDNQYFSSVIDGAVVIPEGQELVIKNGMLYIQNREKRIADIDHKQPLSFGVSVRKNLAKGFSVESGLTYTYLASDIRYEGSAVTTSQKLHYIGIPVRGNWNFVDTKDFTMYVSAGGAVEKCVYGKIGTERETVKPVQFSVAGAVGAQYNINGRTGLYIEPGVSYFFDDGSPVQTIRKENPCNFTLQAGIRLTY